jgi:hypothetical protein
MPSILSIRFSRVNPKIKIYRTDEIRPGTIVCLHTEKNLPTSLNVSVLNPTQFIY